MREFTVDGFVGKDVQVRFGQSGTAFTTINVAVSRKDRDEFVSDWYTVRAFGDLAESCGMIKKGDRIIAVGRLQQGKWTDKNNVERVSMELMADDIGVSVRAKKDSSSNFDNFGNQEEIPF